MEKFDNVVLIGFMGCGKSTIGIKLSYRLRKPFLDTDKLVEKKENCTIKEIFQNEGEASFRKKETGVLQELIDRKTNNYVIATGGGLPIQPQNLPLLKQVGTVVYLRVKPETVYARLKHDKTRPLLQGDDPQKKIRDLLAQRSTMYEKAADVVIDTDQKSFEEILREIVEKVN